MYICFVYFYSISSDVSYISNILVFTMKEGSILFWKHLEVSRSFRDILTFGKIMFQRLGDGVPTATSSTLEGACGYCRPVFVHYPNMPRELVTIALIINLHFIPVSQYDFFIYI